jgi:hypothetical protein
VRSLINCRCERNPCRCDSDACSCDPDACRCDIGTVGAIDRFASSTLRGPVTVRPASPRPVPASCHWARGNACVF